MNSVDITIRDKTYTINKFRPTVGRKIVAQYPLTALPKMANYDQNEAIMVLLMSHVHVHLPNNVKLPLNTVDLINNHVASWDDLVNLEYQTLKFNCPFMQGDNMGSLMDMIKNVASEYLVDIVEKAMGIAIANQMGGEE